MKKVWFMTLAVAAMISTSSFAQQNTEQVEEAGVKEVRNELSVWGLGGISSFMYKPNEGSTTLDFGGGGGIGVGRFFNPNFGLRFGLEFMTYTSEFKAPSFETRYPLTDGDDDNFEFRTGFRNYKEVQKAMMFNVPIMACYEHGWFYAQLGLKLGLSLNAPYTATADSIIMTGYYEDMNNTYKGNMSDYGFTNYTNTRHEGNIKMGLNLALAAEIGAKWKLNNKFSLYTGIYADYGLLNVAAKKNEYLIDYIQRNATANEHNYNSVLNSALSNTIGSKNFTDRVGMLSAGIKIALGINTTTLFASAKNEPVSDAYSDETTSYLAPRDELTKEDKRQLKAEQEEQEKVTKEQEKSSKEKEKAEKQAAKERAKLTPRQQQMEDDIAELKRVQEILMQQAESSNKNQEAILGAVKAAQDAAAAAAEAARAAQTAVMSMQSKDKVAEKKALTAARKDARYLNFKIQISARRTPLENVNEPFAKFGLDTKITEERYTDETQSYIYKYVVGSYKSVDAAVEACNEVREKGITDAFVVAYYRGKRITMAEAYNLLNKE